MSTFYKFHFFFFALCMLYCQVIIAQRRALPQYQPTHQEMVNRYKNVAIKDSTSKNKLYNLSVNAHWLQGNRAFWYAHVAPDSVIEYLYVNAATGVKRSLFVESKLATAMSKSCNQRIETTHLWLKNLALTNDNSQMTFAYQNKYYRYDIKSNKLSLIDSLPQNEARQNRYGNSQFNNPPSRWDNFQTDSLSPDRQYVAYIRDNNVFIKHTGDGETVQYTHDGSNAHPYGSLAWSPDSKCIVGYHVIPVTDSSIYYVLSSVPGTTRGQLRSYEYKQPGDPFTTYEMYVFPVTQATPVKVTTPIIDFFDAPLLHWTRDNSHFFYEKVDRGHQRFRIIDVNVQNGDTRTIVDEQTKTFIYTNLIYTHYLPQTNEILWTSEKDGWRHIYLVDAQTGTIKNEITKGNYVVKDIDSIDAKKREIWFSANGMNKGEDPYYVHYYRIGFDGNHLVALTPAAANHYIVYSPDKSYYLDTYSEINTAPVTELYSTVTGKKISDIEHADISQYISVVKRLPQSFVAKGRDGVTDIYGIVCLPAEFDSTRRYPIVEDIYAGPQDAFVPKSFMSYYSEIQSLADLGFVVVQIDGMGTACRSKAFHDVCWHNLADAGFPDRILWMKALATKYPFADTTRVGLYGTSAGGQNALGGLLFHPEWYKAAVASCGCQDNRIDKQWWNEQWMGYPVGPWYKEQSNVENAYKLQGDLLLIVGEADNNVPPESTYRVADALIKCNKTFEFLPIPGSDHTSGGEYGKMKRRDFFVQHLLSVIPPQRNNGELLQQVIK